MKTIAFLLAILASILPHAEAKPLRVASLHPLLTDLATRIGGENVEVIDVLRRGADPHKFAPSPAELNSIASSDLVLAMGKNLEPYLPKLRDILGPDQTLLEVGRTIPSLEISESDELVLSSPVHSHGVIDPHWWHSIANMRRASKIVATAFAKADPTHSKVYADNAKQYSRKLDELENWAKTRIAGIPRKARILATSHLAFGYFCEEFGFRAMGVEGLTSEHEPTAQHLEETIAILKRENVKAVFPEKGANPKVLARIARDAGVRVGGFLDADGNASGDPLSYEAVVRHNVETIVAGLE